jgi:thiol-disulfide isomerase/thioredoxin
LDLTMAAGDDSEHPGGSTAAVSGDAPRLDRAARRSESFVERIGLAIVQPRWAMAAAADRRYAGRSGTDLIKVIALLLLATQLRRLFAAGWVAVAVDISLGLRGFTQVLTEALTVDLAFLVVGAVALWAVAGPKRDLGRAFDVACVALLPLIYVDLGATTVTRAFDLHVPGWLGLALTIASWLWMLALVIVGAPSARDSAFADVPARVRKPGQRAGWGVIAVAAAGFAVQTAWLANNLEQVRPMQSGDRAPAFALPAIEQGGVLGHKVTLASETGKIVVLDFWATWCKPCLASLPRLDALAKRHRDVVVIAINLDDPKEARELFDAQHYQMLLLADDGETRVRYGVSGIPHTVVIDRDGMVRAVVRNQEGALEAAVQALERR